MRRTSGETLSPMKRQALRAIVFALALVLGAGAVPAAGQEREGATVDNGHVQLDFNDVELSVVIDTIARLTGKNFIYDDRVRGRVTIVSPTKITVDEAYAVFESVLQVKGFTTVDRPGRRDQGHPDPRGQGKQRRDRARPRPGPEERPLHHAPDPAALHRCRGDHEHAEAARVEGRVDGRLRGDQHGDPDRLVVEHLAHPLDPLVDRCRDLQGRADRHQGTRFADAKTMAEQLSEIFDADVSRCRGHRPRRHARVVPPRRLPPPRGRRPAAARRAGCASSPTSAPTR